MRDYRSLTVWQRADEVVLDIYRITGGFPVDERFGLVAQMRRAAVSVASNIAEAAGRSTDPDAARLLSIAAGSASELEYQLDLAARLGHTKEPIDVTLGYIGEVKRMLRSLIKHWRSGT